MKRLACLSLGLALVAALAVGAGWLASQKGDTAFASPGTAVGLDVDPTGNTASSLGVIQRCIEKSVSDTFDIDLYIKDVPLPGLLGWEVYIYYTESIVDVQSVGIDGWFLGPNPPDQAWQDLTGQLYASALDISLLGSQGPTGEGTLARINMIAVGSGVSPLTIEIVALNNTDLEPITPDVYTAQILVGVGEPCPADADNDGIPDDGDGSGTAGDNPCTGGATTNCDDNCPTTPNPDQTDGDGDLVGDACDTCPDANPADQDGDGLDGEDPVDGLDNDGDGRIDEDHEVGQEDIDDDGSGDMCDDSDGDQFTDYIELYLPTSYTDPCPYTEAANDEDDDKWPLDMDDNQRADTGDVLSYSGQVAPPTSVPPGSTRLDLNASGSIDTADVLQYSGKVAPPTLCTP